jgi:hypothetical protein
MSLTVRKHPFFFCTLILLRGRSVGIVLSRTKATELLFVNTSPTAEYRIVTVLGRVNVLAALHSL